jgi:hypothetical protein
MKADQESAMEYFTNLRRSGPVRYNHPCDIVGVIEAIDEPEVLIGLARQVSSFMGDLAIWRLEVHGVPIPGLWHIVDRHFVPAPAGR